MKKMYLNGIGCISAQNTSDPLSWGAFVEDPTAVILPVIQPVYSDYIKPAAIRRMAKGVKNGSVAAAIALHQAGSGMPDAIITGTGMGCMEDSDKFLESIIDNKEEFLTPTSFIQSTHNVVGGQIALGLQCNAYNFTYVNGAVSFESALLDAKLTFDEDQASCILLGGVDKLSAHTAAVFKAAGYIKAVSELPISVANLVTTGLVYGEGATFFVAEDRITPTTYAQVMAVQLWNRIETADVSRKAIAFLTSNSLTPSDVDAVILGINGDAATDMYYQTMRERPFENIPLVYYKHLCGEYNTASAFGLYIGANIVKHQNIPAGIQLNTAQKSTFRYVLLYNQFKGTDHSFILIANALL